MNAHKIDVSGAVLHSDHVFQYTSTAYNTRLEKFSLKGKWCGLVE
ncbi:hypothetical protein MF628_06670 [Paenibacillus polymyxa]|nr:hypothetical protein [Paenibacillus polymyxa]UZP80490.1 hypothetical protein MF628_06670 [Paenibacillus polymyxa]